MTSKRMEFGGKEGPGPGEYEPYRYSLLKSSYWLHCPNTYDELRNEMLENRFMAFACVGSLGCKETQAFMSKCHTLIQELPITKVYGKSAHACTSNSMHVHQIM